MKPITYLCFTLLSIVIQFCLMDFINERMQSDDIFIEHKESDAKNLTYLFKNIKEKPHALYFRKELQKLQQNKTENKKYGNTSLPLSSFTTSTEIATTIFDFYYENTTLTASTLISEVDYNSTEYDNVTEVTFFDKKTTSKPPELPKKNVKLNKDCLCDLLFKKCDINCCCDNECSDVEHNLFNCKEGKQGQCFNKGSKYLCYSRDKCSNRFENMFCIKKFYLPDKKKMNEKELTSADINRYFKWHINQNMKSAEEFTPNTYTKNKPVWFLRNETMNVISLPVAVTSSYCGGLKPIKFLTNEHIRCHVKIKELHFLHAVQLFNETTIVSPKENTTNITKMTCSTLHCVNWTLLVCDVKKCIQYNKDLHEPSCSGDSCDNIAVKVEYIFYCNGTVISNATIRLHTKRVTINNPVVSQEITVTFYMGKENVDDIVKYSGNPGYIKSLPVIVSFFESNHTIFFYNRTYGKSNNILLPHNENGICVLTNITHKTVNFGYNTRLKCRLTIVRTYKIDNESDECLKIQNEIMKMLQLNNDIFISPYGNPNNVNDDKWIAMQKITKSNVYGEYRSNKTKLICYNIMTRFAYLFSYADVGIKKEENKILMAKVEGTMKNVTFSFEDLATVVTVDTSFIDVGATNTRYEGGLQYNINLPQNFLHPLRSHGSSILHTKIIFLCTILFLSK